MSDPKNTNEEIYLPGEVATSPFNIGNVYNSEFESTRIKTEAEELLEKIIEDRYGVDAKYRWYSHLAAFDNTIYGLRNEVQVAAKFLEDKCDALDSRVAVYEQMLQDITMDDSEITIDNDSINFTGYTILSRAAEWDNEILKRLLAMKQGLASDLDKLNQDILEQMPTPADLIEGMMEELSNSGPIKELTEILQQSILDQNGVVEQLRTEADTIRANAVADAQQLRTDLLKSIADRQADIQSVLDTVVANGAASLARAKKLEEDILAEVANRTAALDALVIEVNGNIDTLVSDLTTSVTAQFDSVAFDMAAMTTSITQAKDGLTQEIQYRKDGDTANLNALNTYKVSNDGAISGIQTSLNANVSKTNANATAITGLTSSLNTTNTELGTVRTSAANAMTKAQTAVDANSALSTRVDSLYAAITESEGTTVDVTAFNALKSEVNTINGTVNTLVSDTTALKSNYTNLSDQVSANTAATSSLTTRMVAAEGSISAHNSDITLLRSDVNTFSDNLATKASNEAVSALTSDLSIAKGNITNQASDITRLKTSLNSNSSLSLVSGTSDSIVGVTASQSNKLSLVADTSTQSGSYIKVGANSGNDYVSMLSNHFVNIDPNKLYRVRYRYRRTQGSSSIYLGLMCANASKSSGITATNTTVANDVVTSALFFVTNFKPTSTDWQVGEAYFKDRSTGSSSGSGTKASPHTFPASAAYARISALVGYSSGAGEFDIDYITFEDAEHVAMNDVTASAVQSLTATVSDQGGVLSSHTNSLTSLNGSIQTLTNGLATKANASALNDYYTKVQANDAIAGQITSFNANLEIGGVNLAIGTENPVTTSTVKSSNATGALYGLVRPINDLYAESVSKKCVMSFDWEYIGSTPGGTFYLQGQSSPWTNLSGSAIAVSSANLKGRVEHAFVMASSLASAAAGWLIGICRDNMEGAIKISNLKFEFGTKATTWSPSPQDVKTALDANVTAINSTNTNVSNLNGTVTSQGTRISSMENKVNSSSNGLDTKVSQTTFDTLNNKVTNTDTGLEAVNSKTTVLTTNVSLLNKTKNYIVSNYRNGSTLSGFKSRGVHDGEKLVVAHNRGLNLTLINADGTIGSNTTFDTYAGFAAAVLALRTALEALTTTQFFILTGQDHIGTFGTSTDANAVACRDLLVNCGVPATLLPKLVNYTLPVIVGRKTLAQGAALIQVLETTVSNQWMDTPLTFVDGRPVGVGGSSGDKFELDVTTKALEDLSSVVNHSTTGLTVTNSKVVSLEATVNSTVNGLPSKVSTTAFDTLANKVNSSSTGLDALNSKTTALTTELSNLTVGGENIINGSSFNGNSRATGEIYKNGYVIRAAFPSSGYVDMVSTTTAIEVEGEYVTYSFDAKASVDGTKILTCVYNPSTTISGESSQGVKTTASNGEMTFTLSTSWTRYWVIYKLTKDNVKRGVVFGRLRNGTAGVTVDIARPKVELGTKATDWSESTGDIQNALSANVSAVESLTTRLNTEAGKITANSNKIVTLESKVNDPTTGVSALSTGLNNLKTTVENSSTGVVATSQQLTALTSKVDAIKIGGVNTYSNVDTTFLTSNSNLADKNSLAVPNGFQLGTASASPRYFRLRNVIKSNGWWTISGYARGNQKQPNATFAVDICDIQASGGSVTLPLDDSWIYFSYSVNVTNYTADVYNFVDIQLGGFLNYMFKNIKVEEGNKATAWTPHPDDLQKVIDAKASAEAFDSLKTYVGNDSLGGATSLASKVTALTSTVGNNTNALTVQANVLDGVKAQYHVKMETNGVIGGFGLLQSTGQMGTVTTTFGVNSDRFFIGAPANGKKPFIVTTASQTINGMTYPAGTWIDTALIANATIGTAKIADAAITNAKIANIDAAKITTGTLDAQRIRVGSGTTFDAGFNPAANLQEAKSYVDAVEIGGTNLLKNSEGVFTPNTSKTDNYVIYTTSTVDMINGKEYTLSGETNGEWSSEHNTSAESNKVTLWLVGNGLNIVISDSSVGTKGRTFVWGNPSGTYTLRLNSYRANNSIWFKKIKIESGNKRTDWTPAPSDVNSYIESKSKTFTSQPVTPYTAGDLWKDGTTIRVCTVTRASGSYVTADWTLVGDVTSANTSANSLQLGGTPAATINTNIANADNKAANAQSTANTANNQVNSWKFTGTTNIDGGNIQADTVTAAQISVNDLSAISGNLGSIKVGTANIDDLSVTSLKIADRAVTTSISVTSAMNYNLSTGNVRTNTVGSLTMSTNVPGFEMTTVGNNCILFIQSDFLIQGREVTAGGNSTPVSFPAATLSCAVYLNDILITTIKGFRYYGGQVGTWVDTSTEGSSSGYTRYEPIEIGQINSIGAIMLPFVMPSGIAGTNPTINFVVTAAAYNGSSNRTYKRITATATTATIYLVEFKK